jgi:DNA repair exonuclease SbcCD ATPase subunit
MGAGPSQEELNRLYEEIAELRQCKQELAGLREFKSNSEEKFKEIRDNIDKLFSRIEGNGRKGLKDEIAEIKELLTKFEENITEVYERISKIENLLERTIHEVYELTPIVKALMKLEDDRKTEKDSFRREFRMWIIGFIGSVLLTASVTWVTIRSNSANKPDVKTVVETVLKEQASHDSLRNLQFKK